MQQQFINANYEIVNFNEYADIYVINTCTVTSISDKKSRQMIRKAKQINNKSLVIAVGCYAQVGKDELEKIEELDLILGNNEKKDIIKHIKNLKETRIHVKEMLKDEKFIEFGSVTYIEKTRAVIKVQDGCDRFCSYCIIPYARGKVRSRKPESVVEEIEDLAQIGIKEVVITGIHIASYGKDLKDNIFLIDLLEKIDQINGIERIRLGSLEPTIINEEFIKRLSKLNKVCHHFHLSLQSGNNETLKRMNRRYTTEDFEKAVDLLRKEYKDVMLTTDIIVGFPGETEEEFNSTYEFLKKIKFYKMHIFKYSKREGTKAATMQNQVNSKIQEKRSRKLIELSDFNQLEYNKQHINKEVEVLFEEQNGNIVKGHSQNYILVECKNDKEVNLHNLIKKVTIQQALGSGIIGKIIM